MMYRSLAVVAALFCRAITLALAPGIGSAEDVAVGEPYAERFQRDHVKFDSVAQLFLAFRDSDDRTHPAVAWTDVDNRRAGQIIPLRDLPAKANKLDVWDVAAGPRSLTVVGVVQAGEKALHGQPRHVLLTYDFTGTLRALWEVNPYHHHKIAVDSRGNVYALGHRIDGQPGANVVIKYSADGSVDREFFPFDMLTEGKQAVIDLSSGQNHMWVQGERLLIYMAKPQDLFQFDLEGKLQSRKALGKALARLAKDNGRTRAQIVRLVMEEGQRAGVLAQVQIFGDGAASSILARLPLDGAPPTTVELAEGGELGTTQVPLLGKAGDSMLFLNRYSAKILRR